MAELVDALDLGSSGMTVGVRVPSLAPDKERKSMNVKVESVSQVEKQLSFVVPAEEVNKTLADIYKDLRKEAKLKGFRKGKAPESIVRAHFRDYALQEAEKQIIGARYKEALEEKELNVVSDPEIEMDGLQEGKDFLFKAMVEVKPDLPEMNGYKGIPVKSKLVEVSDKDVENALESIRAYQGKLVVADPDYKAQKGDYLVIDYVGQVDGKPFEDNERKGALHKLGNPDTLAAFDEALTGVMVKEEKTFDITYPEDFPNKDLVGKTATFTVTVKEVKRQELPDLNDDFAKSVGDHASLDALKSYLKKQIEEEREKANHQWMEEQALTFLLNRFSFDVPKSWITRQAGFLLSKFEQDQDRQGGKVEKIPLEEHPQKKVFGELAERQIKSMLVIDEIAKLEGIAVTPEDLAEHYEKFSKNSGATVEQVRNYYESQREQMDALKDDLLRSKTLAFLREHAVVEWVKEEDLKKDSEEKENGEPEEEKGRIILP